MSDGSFVMLMWLVLLQQNHWRRNYAEERHTDADVCVMYCEHIDLGGES